jgi:hypothetical protein
MKKEIFTLNDSKQKMNNSSMITAENSSLFSKINNRNILLNSKEENNKYSNIFIFELPRRGKSLHKSKNKKIESLYLTDLKFKSTKDTEGYIKTNFELLDNSCNNRSRQLSKDSLPNITEYSRYIKKPDCFNCCGMQLNPKYLTRLYNNQFKEKIIDQIIKDKKQKIKNLRDDKMNYIRKTNDIKRINYEINLKKEAMLEYEDNLKNHLNSINHTISNIKSYKDNLENIFINKYNENLRILNNNLRDEKKNSDKQNEELINLKKDVAGLQLLIHKKEAILKKIEKWLILQIYIKDGKKPKNLKNELKKYKNKLIFETPEDLDIIFKNKENKNLRLLTEYNKSDEETKIYVAELLELEKHIGNLEVDNGNVLFEKENVLINLKKKNKELEISLNELNYFKMKYYKINNYNSVQNKRHKSLSLNDDEIKKNELGIFYKPIKNHCNIFVIIDSIYNTVISNNINGLSFNVSYINEINNINTSKSKRAIIQMRIIEICFNFLLSYIKDKINSDRNNIDIIKEAYHMLDLYHKKVKGNKNKLELENKRIGLWKKIEEKNKKVYFLPRGKIEKYNVVSIKNLKNKHRLKNKTVIKNIDIWDFLHDRIKDENTLSEKIIKDI